ncbi:hypothetical protein Dtox_1786 [Desulfofarcimen acetoxidans DSM 771]|uniref:Uncharacterized protein n=1 Tax=Desulfofarcimen acetoxidans (strain ATCC 49208 / DSM 771 / KCTC 5769 / VKM B-1644 / 5575) TaxID=485916 RepID=C8VX63_DESAS|nr:hypothetical protein [Desulfofarcimen acetoxidans]ACV62639.1 hypothetical protein Dtox_1786 [Desulfofarcimen acetoxidans DSM 771]
MESVLIRNGINIQFGGKAYSNDFIIKRIIFNARANKYDPLFNDLISSKGTRASSEPSLILQTKLETVIMMEPVIPMTRKPLRISRTDIAA